ncbi:hypothetical protein CLIB1423_05S01640 [[Candida] railenensis]|uniref:Uncharacterized protein n=1 Tax=[Candida] railenensis TaxID=45579 RepID=A0A9P0QNP9_9ASCO|nr:hypothetical protein CLIB1423_05S01640 [[Candida] railenensis]
MQLQLTNLASLLAALTFVAANAVGVSESFSDLRCVLKYEYRPKFWFSHLKYINYYGRGHIDDWDSIVITYIDEEHRDFLRKEMEGALEGFNEMRFLLSKDVKVGDTLGKSFGKPHNYFPNVKQDSVYYDPGILGVIKTLAKTMVAALELVKKLVYSAPTAIRSLVLFKVAISRNAGLIYEGGIYTISLRGKIWRVAALPAEFDKSYDSTAALNLTDRIGFCIDDKFKQNPGDSLSGWECLTDQDNNWMPAIYFMRGDSTQEVWGFRKVRGFFSR